MHFRNPRHFVTRVSFCHLRQVRETENEKIGKLTHSSTLEVEKVFLQGRITVAKDLPFDRHEINRDTLSDELKAMLDQSEQEYVGWNPEERPQIAGSVADITPNCDCGGFGPHYIIFIDSPEGANVAVHCFHTTLRSQLDERIRLGGLVAGDLIVISYAGKTPSKVKGHGDINNYRVVVRQKGAIHPKA